MTIQRLRFAVKGPGCPESGVEVCSLGLHLCETLALGEAAFSSDMPTWPDFCPAVALTLWQRVSGPPSTESVSVFLTDTERLHESCLPITLDYYKWCYEHQVLLLIETNGGKQQVTKSLDATQDEHGNHDRGQESFLYLKINFMKCCSIQYGDKL